MQKIKVGKKLFDTKEEMFNYFIKLEEENKRLKNIIETPCTSCCVTKSLEQSLDELNDQIVNQDREITNLKKQIEQLEADSASKDECIDNLEHDLKDAGGELELWQRENVELKKETKQLKAQITDIKEDVERERNKQRRLEHDFTTNILNNLLNKWS